MLDRKTRKLLVYISKHENITDDEISEHFSCEMLQEIDVLENNKYITMTITGYVQPGYYKCSYSITPAGRAYLEKNERNFIITLITVTISAFMLLINILNRLD